MNFWAPVKVQEIDEGNDGDEVDVLIFTRICESQQKNIPNMNFWAPAKVQESDEGDDDDGDDAEENDDVDDKADYEILTWICENQHKSKEVYYTHRCQTRKPSSRNDIYVFLKCKLF